MKNCKSCDCEIPKRNKYCNNICQRKYENNKEISEWINGENKTRKGGTSIPSWMRDYLMEESNYSCSECNWGEINPFTHKTTLDVDHIDGDAYNNLKNNLRVLCPNCHSLKETFKNTGKRKSTRKYRNK